MPSKVFEPKTWMRKDNYGVDRIYPSTLRNLKRHVHLTYSVTYHYVVSVCV
jgi:hypothetical protein